MSAPPGGRSMLGAPRTHQGTSLSGHQGTQTVQLSAEYGEGLALNSITGAGYDWTLRLRITELYSAGFCSSETHLTRS